MMHCMLNGTNLGIQSMFSGVTDSTLIWDTVSFLLELRTLCSMGYGPCSLGYGPCSIEIRVSVQSAYAYIYHGVFVCAIFMICIFLFALSCFSIFKMH